MAVEHLRFGMPDRIRELLDDVGFAIGWLAFDETGVDGKHGDGVEPLVRLGEVAPYAVVVEAEAVRQVPAIRDVVEGAL